MENARAGRESPEEDPPGTVHGFCHAEEHVFADGVTWTEEGRITGTPQPRAAQPATSAP